MVHDKLAVSYLIDFEKTLQRCSGGRRLRPGNVTRHSSKEILPVEVEQINSTPTPALPTVSPSQNYPGKKRGRKPGWRKPSARVSIDARIEQDSAWAEFPFSIKQKARLLLQKALKQGVLTKPAVCDSCLKPKRVHGHHEDYTQPLNVEWLCQSCHQKLHNEMRGEER